MGNQVYIEVDIGLHDLESHIDSRGLDGVLTWAQAVVDAVPAEYRENVRIHCYCDYETGLSFDLSYWRPATEADRLVRATDEAAARLANAKARRDLFEALKREFEGQ